MRSILVIPPINHLVRRLQDWAILLGWCCSVVGFIVYMTWKGAEVNAAALHVEILATSTQADHEKILTLEANQENFKDDMREMKHDIKEILRRVR